MAMAMARLSAVRYLTTNLRVISPLNNNELISNLNKIPHIVSKIQFRNSSFASSKPVGDPAQYTDYEIVKNPPEWKYVEQLLGNKLIPEPTPKENYPSGWKPPSVEHVNSPYYVPRTKNHMLPVYLHLTYRGMRKVTQVRKVQGNLWELEKELKKVIEEKHGKKIITQVNEMSNIVNFKGEFVSTVEEYLLSKGF